jgi:cytochrome c oxidase assembly factor CtaG
VPAWTFGFLPLLLVAAADVWVYLDASARRRTRREVTARFLSVEVETPQAWLLWCVVLFLVFFPAYLVARRVAA